MGNTAELDKDLADGLKAAKTKGRYFVLVLKGGNDGVLLVSKTKIAAPAIAEAKKKSGGGAVLSGFVSYEDGTYVFETAKPAPGTAAAAVKIIAKCDAGPTINALFRQSTDPELLGLDGIDRRANRAGHGHGKNHRTASDPQDRRPGPAARSREIRHRAATDWQQAAATALTATDKLIATLEATGDEFAPGDRRDHRQAESRFPRHARRPR